MVSQRIQRQIDRLLDEAGEAVRRSDWVVAVDRAQNVLAFDPENPDALAYVTAADRALEAVSEPSAESDILPEASSEDAPSEPLPAAFGGGRYMVRELLGEGGSKRVYLVHDSLLDRDVAFALFRTERLDATGRQRILREAQTMGRLGDHPNIVQLYDLGEESGQPYMVLPVMGSDVQSVVESASEHRLPLEQTLSIAKDVCVAWTSPTQTGWSTATSSPATCGLRATARPG